MYGPGIRVNVVRVIPTDGRAHDPNADALPNGDSVGVWHGNTLAIDTINIDPESWVDNDGSIHSKDLHVTEQITRIGNALTYKVHMEDPIFLKPFDFPVRNTVLGDAGEHLQENYPCVERSSQHMVESVTRVDDGLSPKDRAATPPPPGVAPPSGAPPRP